jgi:hypothetical protein
MSNLSKEQQKFREEFCEKAAELGVCPSDLLKHIKRADGGAVLGLAKGAVTTVPWYAALALMGGGAALGGLTAYGVKEYRKQIDPTGELLGSEEDPLDEAKKLHLIAKYRNAIDQISGLNK